MRTMNSCIHSILLDTGLRFAGITVFPEQSALDFSRKLEMKKVSVDELKQQFKDNHTDELRYSDISIKYRNVCGKEVLIFNSDKQATTFVESTGGSFEHPLFKKYNDKGLSLRLKKVAYADYMDTIEVPSVSLDANGFSLPVDAIGFDKNGKQELFRSRGKDHRIECKVDYIVFDIVKHYGYFESADKHTETVGELKLIAKELFKYCISFGTFFKNSPIFGYSDSYSFRLMTKNGHKGVDGSVVFSMGKEQYDRKCRDEDFEVVKSTRSDKNIQAWINKMTMIAGDCIVTEYGSLLECNVTSLDRITIPDFINVERNAFEKSSVKEVVVTSPETIIIPSVENDGNHSMKIVDIARERKAYKNMSGNEIKFIEGFDKSLDKPLYDHKLNNIQKQLLLCMLDGFRTGFGGYKEYINSIVNQEFEV